MINVCDDDGAVECISEIDCACWYDTDGNDVCDDDDSAVECISEIDCACFCDTNNGDDDEFVKFTVIIICMHKFVIKLHFDKCKIDNKWQFLMIGIILLSLIWWQPVKINFLITNCKHFDIKIIDVSVIW